MRIKIGDLDDEESHHFRVLTKLIVGIVCAAGTFVGCKPDANEQALELA